MNDANDRMRVAMMRDALESYVAVRASNELHEVMFNSQNHGHPYHGPTADIPTLRAVIAHGDAMLAEGSRTTP